MATRPVRYRGFYLYVIRGTLTKNRKRLTPGRVVMAVGDPVFFSTTPRAVEWIPIIHHGSLDHVRRETVERIVSTRVKKPTKAQISNRKKSLRGRCVKKTAISSHP